MSATDSLAPVQISPVEDIVADMRAGKIVILVDEEDRENEGDLVLAADHVSPEAINFMARYGRGLICLTLTRERCERLNLPPMVPRNGTKMSTAFTVSIEAAEGVTTGISAADRARTVQVAVAPGAQAADLVQPGHIFPLQAVEGGVLMRAGHTEAGCDLAAMAGCSPTAVICEIMKDDGTMARLPDLQLFAAEHGLKIGTIADLIEHRSRTETLVQKLGTRPLHTAFGEFSATAFRDQPSGALHLALVKGQWSADTSVPVRVHEPLSVLDALEVGRSMHSWQCCSTAAKPLTSCWPSSKGRPAQRRPLNEVAWTCAPMASVRRSCGNPACIACSSWANRAACPAWLATGWKSLATWVTTTEELPAVPLAEQRSASEHLFK